MLFATKGSRCVVPGASGGSESKQWKIRRMLNMVLEDYLFSVGGHHFRVD